VADRACVVIPADAAERFWARIDKSGECWLWTGSKTTAGYGNLCIQRKWWYAHRLAYELVVGAIPPGLVLDHLCRVRHCANPAHLEPVTDGENMRRGLAPYGLRTRCKRGHDITDPANVYVQPDGGKRCRPCALEYARANADKRNAHKRNKRAAERRRAEWAVGA
jgi:hypothetical protein